MRIGRILFLAAMFSLSACLPGGGGSSGDSGSQPPLGATPAPPAAEQLSDGEAVRFFQQASFGASAEDISALQSAGLNNWMVAQMALPPIGYTDRLVEERRSKSLNQDDVQTLFWERALHGNDQLRQRMAFALSQIVVVSLLDPGVRNQPETYGTYLDLLQDEALGNYCDIIRHVSLNPSMGMFLTHLGNRKADPAAGFVPDENYAREVMQLFTIGLEVLDQQGRPQGQETYTNEDVEGLAAVFTGLSWANTDFDRPRVTDNNRLLPMEGFDAQHEEAPKSFLGTNVDVGSDPIVSIDVALDTLLEHPNVAPFISKQLIQKLVTSNPSPAYVGRVASAFESGQFELSDGRVIGEGRRCDLGATAAAILMDSEARNQPTDPDFGKLRSPVLRIAQILRTFRVPRSVSTSGRLPNARALRRFEDSSELGMNAFVSPSVFNFYRPGYVGPGTDSAKAGLVTPEFQLATTPSLIGYINEIEDALDGFNQEAGVEYVSLLQFGRLIALADDPPALAAEVSRLLTGSKLGQEELNEIAAILDIIRIRENNPDQGRGQRTGVAIILVATSPQYLVQR